MNLQRVFQECGQSPWLDNLQRSYLHSGKLAELIDSGIRGLTSNPTIFQKAISGSQDYDEQFQKEISVGCTALDAYWEMVIADITGASETFAPLYEVSQGQDGFVSVEVDPRLARDGAGTLQAARALHERINRPNVMIKIPATQQGLPAIETMIAEGRNVNVTLIFSLDRYERVIDAYISGIATRHAQGLPVNNVASVASFFISRVDAETDKQLEVLGDKAQHLLGRTAINQAKLAYNLFTEKFSSDQWKQLAAHGAQVQRPLWASTSTKNPSYSDTLYVDELIGPHTVNTLPEATMYAFDVHGTVRRTIDEQLDTAKAQWSELAEFGIDVSAIAEKLEQEGVASFIDSFTDLIDVLHQKQESLK